jgi:hypothetical protein
MQAGKKEAKKNYLRGFYSSGRYLYIIRIAWRITTMTNTFRRYLVSRHTIFRMAAFLTYLLRGLFELFKFYIPIDPFSLLVVRTVRFIDAIPPNKFCATTAMFRGITITIYGGAMSLAAQQLGISFV